MDQAARAEAKPPLVVDFDGTLAITDSLVDAILQVLFRSPKHLPQILAALLKGKFAFKESLVAVGAYRPMSIPLNSDLISYLEQEKAAGRELHLVSASPRKIVEAVAERTQIFNTWEGSGEGVNLKGAAKARHLQALFPDGFSYAGNDLSDLEVWQHSRSAVTVTVPASVPRELQRLGIQVERDFPAPRAGIRNWMRLLRIHQWSKNALMFVPLMLGHHYANAAAVADVILGYLCMGLVASGTYIINDLSDLDADRLHATKRRRPLASGAVSVFSATLVAAALIVAGSVGALLLDRIFASVLAAYLFLTVAYSLRLKAIALLDVFVLGLLFTLRVVMGLALVGDKLSPWLMVFSLFFFFSLSMAKRHVEIVRALEKGVTGRVKGRGYLPTDAPLTLGLGVASSSVAVTLLFLYVANDAFPAGAYKTPEWLWLISPLVFLWTTRIWLKSHRGRLDDDPIGFALKDGPSLGLGLAVLGCFLMAIL